MPRCDICDKREGFSIQFKVNIPDGHGRNLSDLATLYLCKRCAGSDPTKSSAFADKMIEVITNLRKKYGIAPETEIKIAMKRAR